MEKYPSPDGPWCRSRGVYRHRWQKAGIPLLPPPQRRCGLPATPPALNNPTNVYMESISVKGQMRPTCSVQYRTMIASGPMALLSASFNGCPPENHISRGIVNIEQQVAEVQLSVTNPVS